MYGFCCRSFIGYSRTLCRPVYVYRVLPCKYHAFFFPKDHLIKIVWLSDVRSMLNDLSFFFFGFCRVSIFLIHISVTLLWWDWSVAHACCFRRHQGNRCLTWWEADTGWSAWRKWRDCLVLGMRLDDVIRRFDWQKLKTSKDTKPWHFHSVVFEVITIQICNS